MTSHINPDQILAQMLAGIDEWEKAPAGGREEREAAERATACAAAMDYHMRHGGALPTAWLSTSPDGSGSNTDQLRRVYEERANGTGAIPAHEYRQAFILAFRALHDKETEIARLKTELDRYEGREVIFGLERFLQSNISDGAMPSKPAGTIARATDTGQEWELTPDGWQVRDRYEGRYGA